MWNKNNVIATANHREGIYHKKPMRMLRKDKLQFV